MSSETLRRRLTSFSSLASLDCAMRNPYVYGLALAALLTVGDAACNGNQVGPCGVFPQEPVIAITRVTNAATQTAIPRVTIRSISIDGRSITDPRALIEGLGVPTKNATVSGQDLVCDIDCAFAVEQGRYVMTLSAGGYRDTTVTLDARYRRSESGSGGCPLRLFDGAEVQLTLTPL